MVRKYYLISIVILAGGLFVTNTQAAFYKWVDKNGEMHYTQTPPPADQIQRNNMSMANSASPEERKIINILVGNWEGTRSGGKVFVDFNMDGRFEDRSPTASGFSQNGVGQWSVTGEMIKWEYDKGKGRWKYVKNGTKHFSFIQEISPDKLVIREPNGDLTSLTKIKMQATDTATMSCDAEHVKQLAPGDKWVEMIKNNCVDLVKQMLDAKELDPNNAAANETPLIYAIEMSRKSIVILLLKSGANINTARNSDGVTPLILAAQMGNFQLVTILIGKGASLEAADSQNSTALIVAAKQNHENIVKQLLSLGANLNATDSGGLTALKHAEQLGHKNVVQAIQDYKKLTGN